MLAAETVQVRIADISHCSRMLTASISLLDAGDETSIND
jgi:hypothetical protein